MNLEIIGAYKTAAGSSLVAASALTGNSLQVRAFPSPAKASILSFWGGNNPVAGELQIISALQHDAQLNMKAPIQATKPQLANGFSNRVTLTSNDNLQVNLSGGAAGNIASMFMLNYYEALNGQASGGTFITPEEMFMRSTSKYRLIKCSLTLGATGQWTGTQAINATEDQIKANTNYAICGYTVSANCGAVRIYGTFSGNLGIGGIGDFSGYDYTSEWFIRLSRGQNLPCIPVFNGTDKANISVDAQGNESATSVNVYWNLLELAN